MWFEPLLRTWQNNAKIYNWTASSEFGTYRLCEQRRFKRACASAQSRQNLRCSLIQAVNQEEPSDRKPDPWPLWMAGYAQLKFVMTECSKTQIRLTGLNYLQNSIWMLVNYYSVEPGVVTRSEACPLGMQVAPIWIPTSGTFFRGDLVMKKFLRPFSVFRWFKKSSCQLLAKECALSAGKLPRRLAQERCG